jgi:hypothetical protein
MRRNDVVRSKEQARLEEVGFRKMNRDDQKKEVYAEKENED